MTKILSRKMLNSSLFLSQSWGKEHSESPAWGQPMTSCILGGCSTTTPQRTRWQARSYKNSSCDSHPVHCYDASNENVQFITATIKFQKLEGLHVTCVLAGS